MLNMFGSTMPWLLGGVAIALVLICLLSAPEKIANEFSRINANIFAGLRKIRKWGVVIWGLEIEYFKFRADEIPERNQERDARVEKAISSPQHNHLEHAANNSYDAVESYIPLSPRVPLLTKKQATPIAWIMRFSYFVGSVALVFVYFSFVILPFYAAFTGGHIPDFIAEWAKKEQLVLGVTLETHILLILLFMTDYARNLPKEARINPIIPDRRVQRLKAAAIVICAVSLIVLALVFIPQPYLSWLPIPSQAIVIMTHCLLVLFVWFDISFAFRGLVLFLEGLFMLVVFVVSHVLALPVIIGFSVIIGILKAYSWLGALRQPFAVRTRIARPYHYASAGLQRLHDRVINGIEWMTAQQDRITQSILTVPIDTAGNQNSEQAETVSKWTHLLLYVFFVLIIGFGLFLLSVTYSNALLFNGPVSPTLQGYLANLTLITFVAFAANTLLNFLLLGDLQGGETSSPVQLGDLQDDMKFSPLQRRIYLWLARCCYLGNLLFVVLIIIGGLYWRYTGSTLLEFLILIAFFNIGLFPLSIFISFQYWLPGSRKLLFSIGSLLFFVGMSIGKIPTIVWASILPGVDKIGRIFGRTVVIGQVPEQGESTTSLIGFGEHGGQFATQVFRQIEELSFRTIRSDRTFVVKTKWNVSAEHEFKQFGEQFKGATSNRSPVATAEPILLTVVFSDDALKLNAIRLLKQMGASAPNIKILLVWLITTPIHPPMKSIAESLTQWKTEFLDTRQPIAELLTTILIDTHSNMFNEMKNQADVIAARSIASIIAGNQWQNQAISTLIDRSLNLKPFSTLVAGSIGINQLNAEPEVSARAVDFDPDAVAEKIRMFINVGYVARKLTVWPAAGQIFGDSSTSGRSNAGAVPLAIQIVFPPYDEIQLSDVPRKIRNVACPDLKVLPQWVFMTALTQDEPGINIASLRPDWRGDRYLHGTIIVEVDEASLAPFNLANAAMNRTP